MHILIVENDAAAREELERTLRGFGRCDVAENGQQGIEAFGRALRSNDPYGLVCLEILMPQMDGQQALKTMRILERSYGVRPEKSAAIIVITALDDERNISEAYYAGGATAYIPKPVEHALLPDLLRNLRIVP